MVYFTISDKNDNLDEFLIPLVDLYYSFLVSHSLFRLQVSATSFKFVIG